MAYLGVVHFAPPQKERKAKRKEGWMERMQKGKYLVNNIDMDLMVGGRVSTPK